MDGLSGDVVGEVVRRALEAGGSLAAAEAVSTAVRALVLDHVEASVLSCPTAKAGAAFRDRFADGEASLHRRRRTPSLRRLIVAGIGFDDAALACLHRACTVDGLVALDLSRTCVTGVEPLRRCTALTALDLCHTLVADVGPLAACTALHTLDLSFTQVADIGPLRACTALKAFHARSARRLACLDALSGCTALETLDLRFCDVSDVAPLGCCPNLRTLDLFWNSVNHVEGLATCTALTQLDLSYTSVACVAALGHCTALTALNLTWTCVTDVHPLRACTALRDLGLRGVRGVDFARLGAGVLRGLQTLDASNIDDCPDALYRRARRLHGPEDAAPCLDIRGRRDGARRPSGPAGTQPAHVERVGRRAARGPDGSRA
jgi:Leucine-rich repeat (LRR) protein